MGQLMYGSTPAVFELDDRTLAHVEIVVLAKLRRGESFAMSIDGAKGTRSSIWLHPAVTVEFVFGSAKQEINRQWLEDLIDSANSSAGMRIVPEPETSG